MTLTDFLLARIAEDEEVAREAMPVGEARTFYTHFGAASDDWGVHYFNVSPARVLAECEAKRRIIEWHKSWPVLATTPPTFERVDGTDPSSAAFRASSQMAWLTEQEYRNRFGTEPPTGPVLRFLALPYADHPDYNPEWRP